MAKGRNREKSKKTGRDAAPAERPEQKAVVVQGVKRHLRRLERLLADAAKKEGKRIRKLERARWRRQRLEAEIMVIRGAPAAAAPAKARPVKTAAAAKPVTGGAAARRTAPRAAPAKPASPRRAPSSRSTPARTSPGKASPGDGATPKT